MRSNLVSLFLLSLTCMLPACAAETSPASGATASQDAPETEDQKILYTLGQVLGQNIENARLSEEELASVILGFSDSALRRESQVDINEYGPLLQTFMDQRIAAAAEGELTEAQAFVAEQAGMAGAVLTDSGMVIQEIEAGTGDRPAADDVVSVHYHGTLRDGSVFDSSLDRGEPATFPLNQVIPCWTEGLQSIQVGGKGRLVCPPELAYGPAGRPGIPGNAALVFEVELLEIVQN